MSWSLGLLIRKFPAVCWSVQRFKRYTFRDTSVFLTVRESPLASVHAVNVVEGAVTNPVITCSASPTLPLRFLLRRRRWGLEFMQFLDRGQEVLQDDKERAQGGL